MTEHPACLETAKLIGVTECPGENLAKALVFHIGQESGHRLDLPLGSLLEALRFAQTEGVVSPLPEDWWARTGNAYGCSF